MLRTLLLGNCFWREDLEAGLGWEIVSEPRYLYPVSLNPNPRSRLQCFAEI